MLLSNLNYTINLLCDRFNIKKHHRRARIRELSEGTITIEFGELTFEGVFLIQFSITGECLSLSVQRWNGHDLLTNVVDCKTLQSFVVL